jgi:predicted RNA-binding Zn-ribbon protein involved in translation (DUF1610 family)
MKKNCPDCKNEMIEGHLDSALWREGDYITSIELGKREVNKIKAFKCTNCGKLELFAEKS